MSDLPTITATMIAEVDASGGRLAIFDITETARVATVEHIESYECLVTYEQVTRALRTAATVGLTGVDAQHFAAGFVQRNARRIAKVTRW